MLSREDQFLLDKLRSGQYMGLRSLGLSGQFQIQPLWPGAKTEPLLRTCPATGGCLSPPVVKVDTFFKVYYKVQGPYFILEFGVRGYW